MFNLNLESQTLAKLQQQLGSTYSFLGFALNLQNGNVIDNLRGNDDWKEIAEKFIAPLFTHYANAKPTPITGKLVKFRELPGGCAYEEAFIKRAVQPIAEVFGANPVELSKAAKLLGGASQSFRDASAEISALNGIPLTYIVWGAEDYPASANILYDKSASNFLPTEDLAVIGELTTDRLIEAKTKI